MKCPNGHKTEVAETRESHIGVRRRRHCSVCGWRGTTYEITATSDRPGDDIAAVLTKQQLRAIRKMAKATAELIGEIEAKP